MIKFREGNNDQMLMLPGGDVTIGTETPLVPTNQVGTRLSVQAANAAGQDQDAEAAISGQGGQGADAVNKNTRGGFGVFGQGGLSGGAPPGSGTPSPGAGGVFAGGSSGVCSGDGCGGDGIEASPGTNSGSAVGYAGNFQGDVLVTGAIFAVTKDFKIDHPRDPANKYLLHSSVESSEMMNIYTGNVTTNTQGDAVVQLPDWFQAENADFRYQLTVIGQFAQAIVASEIADNRFSIRTDKPNVKVSWQVTAVRQDAYAKAHPLVIEQVKGARERGYYIHPELYGAPEEKGIMWGMNPQMMRHLKQIRAKQMAELQPVRRTVATPTVQPRAVVPVKPIAIASTPPRVARQN